MISSGRNNARDNKGNANSELLNDIKKILLIFFMCDDGIVVMFKEKRSPYFSEMHTETFIGAVI